MIFNLFSRKPRAATRIGPMIYVRPYVDCREPGLAQKVEDAALYRKYYENLAANKARREAEKVNQIAVDYAEDMAPSVLAMQAD